jgi:5-methylthioadenosine/S-adenosylhomocysteine deaminase
LGPDVALVHCVHVDNEDIDIIKKANARIIICPRSNIRLKAGIPPLMEFLEAGINVSIGTDSLASSPDLSILEEMRHLAVLFPNIDKNEILKMATINNSRLFMSEQLGVIEAGAYADISAWNCHDEMVDDPVSALVDIELPLSCEYVLIDGRLNLAEKR